MAILFSLISFFVIFSFFLTFRVYNLVISSLYFLSNSFKLGLILLIYFQTFCNTNRITFTVQSLLNLRRDSNPLNVQWLMSSVPNKVMEREPRGASVHGHSHNSAAQHISCLFFLSTRYYNLIT